MTAKRQPRPDRVPLQSSDQRNCTELLCRHLALVAVDGATDEVALTLSPTFELHLDGLDTDRAGYLALIAANHAAHSIRPPLDVIRTVAAPSSVTALLHPAIVLHARIHHETITSMWITERPDTWHHWTHHHDLA